MQSEPESPSKLFKVQKWFASIITRPIDIDSQMASVSPSGRPMSEEAAEFIAPGIKLPSDKRIQIYNQQYWWRLFSNLHKIFPTVTRLFGYNGFNHLIAIPYLTKYPPRHWSLALLGNKLMQWIDEDYHEDDKLLLFLTAELDLAYHQIFFSPAPVSLPFSPDLLTKKGSLQPHLYLFEFPFDLFSFRTAFLKESVPYWLDNEFPPLPQERTYFFVLYRSQSHRIVYQELQEGHWTLLKFIADGMTIEEACDALEKQGGKAYEEAAASLPDWIKQWVLEGWII